MDVPVLAVNLTQQSPVSALATIDPAVEAVLSGSLGGADLFAALLAQQMGQINTTGKVGKGDVLSTQAPEEKVDPQAVSGSADALIAAMTNPAAVDPALLAQQAALVPHVTPPVANDPGGISTSAAQDGAVNNVNVAEVSLPVPGAIADAKSVLPRQPVAADSATFAMPQGAAQPPKSDELIKAGAQAAVTAQEKAIEPAAIQLPVTDKAFETKLTLAEGSLPSSQAQQVIAAPSAIMHSGSVNNVAATQGSTQPVSSISPQVGHSAWGESLSDRVVWMVGQNHQGVELHLNPPSLGPLEVRLSMSDGQANLSFATQHLTVKEAIDSATPRLREMLGDSGISLGSVSVNVGSFTQQGPNDQAQQFSAGRAVWPDITPVTDFAVTSQNSISQLNRNGLVDTFA